MNKKAFLTVITFPWGIQKFWLLIRKTLKSYLWITFGAGLWSSGTVTSLRWHIRYLNLAKITVIDSPQLIEIMQALTGSKYSACVVGSQHFREEARELTALSWLRY